MCQKKTEEGLEEILSLIEIDDLEENDIKTHTDNQCCSQRGGKICYVILLLILIILACVSILGTGSMFYLNYQFGTKNQMESAHGLIINRIVDERIIDGRVPLEYFFFVSNHEYFGTTWLSVSNYGNAGMNSTERLEVLGSNYPPGNQVDVYYRQDQPGLNLAIYANYLDVGSILFIYKWISFVLTGSFLIIIFITMLLDSLNPNPPQH